jgi:hypothetical protein
MFSFIPFFGFLILLITGACLSKMEWWHAGICMAVAVVLFFIFAFFAWPFVVFIGLLYLADAILFIIIFGRDINLT